MENLVSCFWEQNIIAVVSMNIFEIRPLEINSCDNDGQLLEEDGDIGDSRRRRHLVLCKFDAGLLQSFFPTGAVNFYDSVVNISKIADYLCAYCPNDGLPWQGTKQILNEECKQKTVTQIKVSFTIITSMIGGTKMNETTYGYIRVSTKEQNEDRQRIAMREFGVEDSCIFMDKQSGKDFERPGYQRLMKKIKPADTLIIKSIDRLGRNYEEILAQWRIITKEKQVGIVVLDMPLLDTRQGRDLTGTLIADIVLQLLSYVAQTEREYIRQRQAEGIAAAKARGVKFGRKPMKRPPEFDFLYKEWKNKRLSARKAAALLGVTHRTFAKWVSEKCQKSTGLSPLEEPL